MYARTFICYPCMRVARSGIYYNPHCPDCGKSMYPISWRLSIPKRDRKLWDKTFTKWGKVNPYYRLIKEGKDPYTGNYISIAAKDIE